MVKTVGFEPVERVDARVLILGTLPGRVSLERREYYAQPRNAFWRIMGKLFRASPDSGYKERLRVLKASGIALWDVCASGHRPGSLDSSIQLSTAEANDLISFLRNHTHVGLVCFNGKKAKEIFCRKVLPDLPVKVLDRIRLEVLPSTSPANTTTFDQKLSRWRAALQSEIR